MRELKTHKVVFIKRIDGGVRRFILCQTKGHMLATVNSSVTCRICLHLLREHCDKHVTYQGKRS
jgi:hypothetical protein